MLLSQTCSLRRRKMAFGSLIKYQSHAELYIIGTQMIVKLFPNSYHARSIYNNV